ncbi:MAG: GGDEF domain-containing protein [Desulfobacteraceae bacterium]|nr:GGDEF domain-containing protein [Desulfobacteraceae bacterium]
MIKIRQFIVFILNNGILDKMDLDSSRKIHLLNMFCLIGVTFIFPISILTFRLQNYLLFTLDLLVMAFFASSFFYLRKTSRFDNASHIFIHSLFVLILYLVYSGGVEGTGPVWIFIFPVTAIFLYDLKRGLNYTLVFTGLVLVIFFLPDQSLGATVYPMEFKIRIFVSYMTIVIITAVYEYSRQETFLRMKELSRQLDIMAKHDALTGLLNRRGLYDRLKYEHARMKRNKNSFSILIGDIDFFKTINDRYGHTTGDRVLKRLARLFAEQIRSQDLVARWGGEEFLILLPDTNVKGAYTLGEKIRRAIENLTVEYSQKKVKFTMSFGVAEMAHDRPYEEGITLADRQLFKAKSQGRNRVLPLPEE